VFHWYKARPSDGKRVENTAVVGQAANFSKESPSPGEIIYFGISLPNSEPQSEASSVVSAPNTIADGAGCSSNARAADLSLKEHTQETEIFDAGTKSKAQSAVSPVIAAYDFSRLWHNW
jgi:hypothetical protein